MEEKTFYPFYRKRVTEIIAVFQKEFRTKLRTGQSFWDSIGKCLYDVLYSASVRVLIAHMHACKDAGKLLGKTPKEEYDSYCRLLGEESFRDAIAAKYAGLSHYLNQLEQNQLAFWREVLYRLEEDWKRIGEVILGSQEGAEWQLETVKWTGSDFHNKGKAVIVLETNQGIRFFYKPHSLQNEIFLQSLLREIGDEIGLEYPALPILVGKDYGWVREIPYQECGDREGVGRFYQRIGVLAAVSYILGIGDLHYENMIAWGEFPVMIDAEAMFQNMADLYEWSANGREFYSVLSSGLFPGGV